MTFFTKTPLPPIWQTLNCLQKQIVMKISNITQRSWIKYSISLTFTIEDTELILWWLYVGCVFKHVKQYTHTIKNWNEKQFSGVGKCFVIGVWLLWMCSHVYATPVIFSVENSVWTMLSQLSAFFYLFFFSCSFPVEFLEIFNLSSVFETKQCTQKKWSNSECKSCTCSANRLFHR